jgi:hypothetical protein
MSRPRDAYCSFCCKSHQEVGPLVEGPGDVYICGECIELCQTIIDQERCRRSLGTLSDYLQVAAVRTKESIEGATSHMDPRIREFRAEGHEFNAQGFRSLLRYCQAAALLTVVSGILKNVREKGLQPGEASLLEEVETKVDWLQDVLSARADQEASR